ncbi:MAG TPA: energy transducer TonB, partial [Chitinophagaceae bacterium]|nr:energy transducer TonB [Chitinophagaceae bacterium]
MEAGTILSADVLDIIFDNRNKDYGAYDLRKHYQQRLMKSLIVTLLFVVLICITYLLLGSMKTGNSNKLLAGPEVTLDKVKPMDKKQDIVVPPLPKQVTPPAIKMQQFTKPLIVDNPPENERPPEQSALETAKIGPVTTNGADDKGIEGPPVDEAKGIVDPPKKKDEGETIFTRVEIESQYPGGLKVWAAFVYRNLVYPQEAIDNEKEGTVQVQFIVDKEGNVSDVIAISGPEELRASGVAVIKKSGKWSPA